MTSQKNNIIGIKDNQISDFGKIKNYVNRAAKSWENNNNSDGKIKDNSTYLYNRAEKIAKKYNDSVELDCGVGLYPTFEFIYNGKKCVEYNAENFFKRINGFWD